MKKEADLKVTALQSGNLLYEWWCPKCNTYHYDQYCPRDELETLEFANIDVERTFHFKTCPHCGQLINRR